MFIGVIWLQMFFKSPRWSTEIEEDCLNVSSSDEFLSLAVIGTKIGTKIMLSSHYICLIGPIK